MLRLNSRQRELLSEKLSDAGNLAAGALVFGQIIGGGFSVGWAVGGLAIWVGLMAWAIVLLKRRKP